MESATKKEQQKQRSKAYYEENKEKWQEYGRNYYHQHKDKFIEKYNQTKEHITCECVRVVVKKAHNKHLESKIHNKLMSQN
jgi:hypothetical protein